MASNAPNALNRLGQSLWLDNITAAHSRAGIDLAGLAKRLQSEGAKEFVKSWRDLLAAIDAKSKVLA